MSKPEVYAILGRPREYLTRDAEYDGGAAKELGQAPQYSHKEGAEVWKGDQAVFWVQFDTAGHVSGATCIPLRPTDHGLLGNLLWRIKYCGSCFRKITELDQVLSGLVQNSSVSGRWLDFCRPFPLD
jgi:hypothetical protein